MFSNRKKICLLLLVMAATALSGGCAIGNKYAFHSVAANVGTAGNGAVAVATIDNRDYVVAGEKTPQFVCVDRVWPPERRSVASRHSCRRLP